MNTVTAARFEHADLRLSHVAKGSSFMLSSAQRVAAGVEETFAFFSNAANLQAITPSFLDFRILTPLPIVMREGTLIEYRLRLMGIPMGWLTRIEEWRPHEGFTDVQLRGPYARWIHRHRFIAVESGTRVLDEVEYTLPLAPLSHAAHAMLVRPQLARIFSYRQWAIARVLG